MWLFWPAAKGSLAPSSSSLSGSSGGGGVRPPDPVIKKCEHFACICARLLCCTASWYDARSRSPAPPQLQPAHPPPLAQYAFADVRNSALCFCVSSALFLTWLLVFAIGGPAVVGQHLFDTLDVTRLDVWGVMTGSG